MLDERASHAARKSRFIDELEDFMGEDDAEQTLRAIISLARYGEVFAYDDENACSAWRTLSSRGWVPFEP